ncbi:DUF2911 domain-containing protein [Zeaxanthinibacter enoshimensis]|uniref:Uncharacterized protein n=1 Tax=Zeaxanthinibacter enoshimensis TaxID=392009 RepID=A0A4R6TJ30_9FLAO|nr:DUF2911 domain-containing protein [Zeaxanthinibacter enoshimensis]TDQ30864.1 Protein of unknown function (DUF2911) [Zeaxanthinibacter enoshimensis]
MRAVMLIAFLLYSSMGISQLEHPKASPLAVSKQHFGLSTITVTYSRPAVNGRKIFGNLVPYDRIWRVGANESTKFTCDSELEVLGSIVPAGTYALYAFPGEKVWEIVFHKNITHWGDGRDAYNSEEDLFRVTLPVEKLPELQENFLITFDKISHNDLQMLLEWEYSRVRIPIVTNTHDRMLRQIDSAISGNPTAQTYYEAARYLQEQQTDYETALQYLERAIVLGGDTYYFHRVKSLVQAARGDYGPAIASAQRSMKLAAAEGKDEFVRMNRANIEAWKKLQD